MQSEKDAGLSLYSSIATASRLERLAQQIEYYFSDANLPTDEFLFRKTMKRCETAWVPISTLLTFNRLKQEKTLPEHVVAALQWRSSFPRRPSLSSLSSPSPFVALELSADNLKIRRANGFPSDIAKKASLGIHCVRVSNLESLKRGKESISIEDSIRKVLIAKLDTDSSGVVSVTLDMGGERKGRFPQKPSAVVELASQKLAEKAVELFATSDWRKGLVVKKLDKTQNTDKEKRNNNESSPEDSTGSKKKKKKKETVASARQKGKVRTLDKSNFAGFIAPMLNKGKKSNRVRSIPFTCISDAERELFNRLNIGSVVTYQVKSNEDGSEAVELDLVEPAAGKKAEDEDVEEQARRKFILQARAAKPNADESRTVFKYAIGPPNDASSYLGFGLEQWRGRERTITK